MANKIDGKPDSIKKARSDKDANGNSPVKWDELEEVIQSLEKLNKRINDLDGKVNQLPEDK